MQTNMQQNRDKHDIHRLTAILNVDHGYTATDIFRILCCTRFSVYHWHLLLVLPGAESWRHYVSTTLKNPEAVYV